MAWRPSNLFKASYPVSISTSALRKYSLLKLYLHISYRFFHTITYHISQLFNSQNKRD